MSTKKFKNKKIFLEGKIILPHNFISAVRHRLAHQLHPSIRLCFFFVRHTLPLFSPKYLIAVVSHDTSVSAFELQPHKPLTEDLLQQHLAGLEHLHNITIGIREIRLNQPRDPEVYHFTLPFFLFFHFDIATSSPFASLISTKAHFQQ